MCMRARNEANFWVVCFGSLQARGIIWIMCKLTATCVRVLLSITLIMRDMDQGMDSEKIASRKRKERSYPCGSGTVCAVKLSGVGDKFQDWLWCRCFVYFIMLVVKNIYISPVKYHNTKREPWDGFREIWYKYLRDYRLNCFWKWSLNLVLNFY